MNKFLVPEFKTNNDKKYKIKAIQNSVVYAKKVGRYLLGLYYLIVYKRYLEEENI